MYCSHFLWVGEKQADLSSKLYFLLLPVTSWSRRYTCNLLLSNKEEENYLIRLNCVSYLYITHDFP
jgi:hypothetical protein